MMSRTAPRHGCRGGGTSQKLARKLIRIVRGSSGVMDLREVDLWQVVDS